MAAEWLRKYSSSSISQSPSFRRKASQGQGVSNISQYGPTNASANEFTTERVGSHNPSEGSCPGSVEPGEEDDLEIRGVTVGFRKSTQAQDQASQIRAGKSGVTPDQAVVIEEDDDDGDSDLFIKRRRSSVTFDSSVRIDSGVEGNLKTPSVPKLCIKTRPRGKSLLDEMAKQTLREQTKTGSDSQEHDSVTRERLDERKPSEQSKRSGKFTAHQPRWPLLQSTVDGLASEQPEPELSVNLSLTSNATLSPEVDEAKTPDDIAVVSPINIASPIPEWNSTPQDIPTILSKRSKSYAIERQSSHSSRFARTSRRSTANSSSASPASTFLAKYMPSSPVTQPDDEGQEIGEYVLGREIGFGGFSVIREAHTISGDEKITRAVKIVRKNVTDRNEQDNDNLQAEFEREVEIWRSLVHDNILPLYAVYDTDFATFAITQLNTGGTLFDAVRTNRSGLRPALVKHYAFQLATALCYLHEEMHIIHRDVKLENCLVDMTGDNAQEDGGKLLLCDFGLADYEYSGTIVREADNKGQTFGAGMDPRTPSTASWMIGPAETSTNFAGSLPYAAPELLQPGKGNPSTSVDLWAYGVVLYALTMGRLPFQHAFTPRLTTMIIDGDWDKEGLRTKEEQAGEQTTTNEPASNSHKYNPNPLGGLSELIECCLELDPLTRWDIQDVLCSRWLQDEIDKIGTVE